MPLPPLRTYVFNAFCYGLPPSLVATFHRGGEWWMAPATGALFAAVGALIWCIATAVIRYGGDLGRKLARPV